MNPYVLVVTPILATRANKRLDLYSDTVVSALNQTYPYFLNVVVDDGSELDVEGEVRRITGGDERFVVVKQENRGIPGAVNRGVRLVKGREREGLPYEDIACFTVLHSDDIWTRDSLEVRVGAFEGEGVKAVYSNEYTFNTNYQICALREGMAVRDEYARALLKRLTSCVRPWSTIPYHTLMWDLDFFTDEVGLFNERVLSSEDTEIAIRTFKTAIRGGGLIGFVDKATAYLRVHKNNAMIENVMSGKKLGAYKIMARTNFEGLEYYKFMTRLMLRLLFFKLFVTGRNRYALKNQLDTGDGDASYLLSFRRRGVGP